MLKFTYLDTYNESNYEKYGGRRKGKLHCTCCGEVTTISDSFSNRGHYVVCLACVDSEAEKQNLSISEVLKNEVWNKG